MQKEFKRGLAAVCSLAMLASSMAFPGGTFVSAEEGYQLLGETTFDYKMIPWHTVESSPAKQNFEITEDGEVHITILRATGEDGEKWDLQFRHRNIDLKKGHTYEVSCQVKSKRAGLKLCSQISNIKGDEYFADWAQCRKQCVFRIFQSL